VNDPAHGVASGFAADGTPVTTLADSWRRVRDRLVASPRFRALAAAFPLTRPIARRRARALFDLTAGFVYSQVLFACVRLDLFARLAAGPQSVAMLARQFGLSDDAARRLLAAAAALQLAEARGDDAYGLGPLGAAMVGNVALARMIEHHTLLYADLVDPVDLLRNSDKATALSSFWTYARAGRPGQLPPAQVGDYTALMAATQTLVAGEILAAYPFGRHRCLLDVGGGDGTFLAAVAASAPQLQLVLFDLPAVAARARARLVAAGLGNRARVAGGDFRTTPLPVGADVISLVRVVHDHDDPTALALLRAARLALPPDGTLVLAEPMADTPGAQPMGDAYFGFYLLAMRSGRPRSADTLRQMLAEAGFHRVRMIRTRVPLQTGLIVAKP
jgi:demethylspheroidene O-methyltransferase